MSLSFLIGRLRRFRRDESGSVMAEVLVAITLIMILGLGTAEVGRYILLNQKLDRVAASMGDLVSQAESLTETDVSNMFEAAQHVIAPFDLGLDGRVIISSISVSGANPPTINWQRSGAGTMSAASQFGSEGGTATLPTGFTIAAGESIIVSEVYYNYIPWPAHGITEGKQIYRRSLFRPRFGALTTIWP